MQKYILIFVLTISALSHAQTPQLIVPTGHTRGLNSFEISPDGKFLYTHGDDGKSIIWDMRTGAQLRNLKDAKSVSTVSFSSDGKKYAVCYSGLKESNVKVFEMETERLLFATTQAGDPQNSYFSKDDKYLVTAGGDYRMTVFETATGKMIKQFGTPPQPGVRRLMADDSAKFIAVSADQRFYAIGTGRQTIDVFEVSSDTLQPSADGKPKYSIGKFEKDVTFGKWSPDGKLFLFSTSDGKLFCWSAAELKGLWQSTDYPANANSIVWSSDSSKFTIVQNETLHEVNARTGLLLSNTANKLSGNDTEWFATWKAGEYLKLIGKNSLALVDWKSKTEIATFRQRVDNGWHFSMARDVPTLISFGSGVPQLWDLANGRMRRVGVAPDSKFLIIDPKGQRLVNPAGLMDLKSNSNNPLFSLTGAGTVWSQDWSPDGRYFGLGAYYKTPNEQFGTDTLFLFDAVSGKAIINRKLKDDDTAHAIVFSPDSRWMVVGFDKGKIEVYDTASGSSSKSLKLPFDKNKYADTVHSLVFSSDGKTLYASVNEEIKSINVASWKVNETPFESAAQEDWALSISPDNRLLLGSGTKGLIHLYDTQSAKLLRTFKGHIGNIMGVRWLKDGKHFVSVGDDQSLRIWDKDTEREQLQLFGFAGGDDWVAVTADGRFDGTPGGIANLYFVKGLDVIPLEGLYDKYYTPSLLKRIIAGENLSPISEKDDIKNLKTPPLVKILPPVDLEIRNLEVADDSANLRRYASKTGRIKLTVEASANDDGISELRLFHNGKAVGTGTRNLSVEDDKLDRKKTQTFEIQLSEGDNNFRAVALNAQRTESRPDEIIVANNLVKVAPKENIGSTLHVLIVGINQYKNPKYNLNYATADATAFKEAIERTSSDLYAKVNAVFIGDANATKANITSEMDKIKTLAQPRDVFIFYYAGHGVMTEKKEFYIVPNDVTQLYGADEALAQKGLSSSLMQQYSREIKAQKQLFILDACQSAAALDQVAMRGAAEEKAIAQLARATGTHWLTASGSEQFASEFKQLGHGTFTYVLLEALSGKADKGSDRKITVKELDAYLQEIVPEVTAKYKGTAQYPASYGFGNDFPIGIVK